MNGKKSRALRKKIYKDKNFRDRKYAFLEGTATMVNVEEGQKVATRRIYRRIKCGLS